MKLFQMSYNRHGHKDTKTLTICTPGIVSATELAARLASSWKLTNWTIEKVPFRKHTRKHHIRLEIIHERTTSHTQQLHT